MLQNLEDPNYKIKVQKSLLKTKLTELFDEKYSEQLLEKLPLFEKWYTERNKD